MGLLASPLSARFLSVGPFQSLGKVGVSGGNGQSRATELEVLNESAADTAEQLREKGSPSGVTTPWWELSVA